MLKSTSTQTFWKHLYCNLSARYFSLLTEYENKVKHGLLRDDLQQRKVISALIKVNDGIVAPKKMFFKNSCLKKGLYIYGNVGTGKTMLMDLFYHSCTDLYKKRIHFHQFMIEVHKEMHEVKKSAPLRTNWKSVHFDPIPLVANKMCKGVNMLCFDEFQVTDIADAMILKRLFENIFSIGTTMVATSNRHPDDLYKNGLQRVNFIPFIALLKEQCEIFCIDSVIDYRKMTLPRDQILYFTNLNSDNPSKDMHTFFQTLTGGADITEKILIVFGRKLLLKKTCKYIIYASFSELCESPLSAVDYMEITKSFHTMFLEGVPKLSINERDSLRRFITLIDSVYDSGMRLVCSAENEPNELFCNSEDEMYSSTSMSSHRVLMDDLGLRQANVVDRQLSIFTGEEEMFANARTVSRLTEMRTKEYWDSCRHHLFEKE